MTKSITFIACTPRRHLVTLPVELETLSTVARQLADLVCTTENADDLSTVYIRCKLSNREKWREQAEKRPWDTYARQQAEAWERVDDMPLVNPYYWDDIREHETPEQYFERHAARITAEGWYVVGGWMRDTEIHHC